MAGIQSAQFDPDALTFINVAAITDTTQRYAINNLVEDLKINGLWTKMKAIYPMVGGNATSHSYNLRNTSQYNLTFVGGWTHNSTGAIPNGVNAGALTGLNASTVLSGTSNHLSFYSLTNSKAGAGVGKVDIGCQIGPTTAYFVSISDYQLFVSYMYSNAAGFRVQIPEGTTAAGLMLATVQSASSFKTFTNRYASSVEGFVQNAQITTLQGSLPNNEIYLCRNGNTSTAYDYSDRGCGIATIGDGLTDADVQNFGAIIQRYVNTLGRQQISIPTVQDLDAFSFLVSAGITDSTQATAVSNLTSGLKYYGLWSKMQAIYPFVGGVSTSHRMNLKTPSNLDSSFRLTFNGGWTHSSTGALPNGTNAYADTKYIASTSANLTDAHFSIYSRTAGAGAFQNEFGVANANEQRMVLITRWTTNALFADLFSANQRATVSPAPTTTGLFTVSRNTSTELKVFRNGSEIGSSAAADALAARPTIAAFLSGFNNAGTPANFSSKELAFATIGTALTATEQSNFYTVVQAYQTELSRQV